MLLGSLHFSGSMHKKLVNDCDSFYWQTSCEEYLCDLLCFHLDVACFVSSVNSGRQWNLRNSLLFTQQEQDSDVNSTEILDPFVENLILERLAVQTPIRVSSNLSLNPITLILFLHQAFTWLHFYYTFPYFTFALLSYSFHVECRAVGFAVDGSIFL